MLGMGSVLVKEEMKTNHYLITVTNRDLLSLEVKHINFLFPITEYSVGYEQTFSIEEIVTPNSFLYLNRILDKQSISNLKKDLSKLNQNIIGICFTDLAIISIVKDLGLSLKLIYMQNHNTTNVVSINYYLEYVDSIMISTDITEEEIMYILDHAKKPLLVPYFCLMDVMYSRRTLLSNFGENFGLEKKKNQILHERISNQDFLAVENDYGTVLYAKKFIDYRNIEHENILYRYLNPIGLDKKMVEKVLNHEELNEISDTGFLHLETFYHLKEEEL